MTREISARLYVDWNFDDTFTEETTYFISASGEMRLVPIGQSITASQGIISRMSLTMDNSTGRFSPLNTTGPLYSQIQDGQAYHAPCYLSISHTAVPSHHRIFTGVMKIPQETTATLTQAKTIVAECRSNEERFLNRRLSTVYTDTAAWYDAGMTEGELIEEVLKDVGLIASDYDIDTGNMIIPWFWMDNESVIETCWQLAAATGGRFYADPDGDFVYENASHWVRSPHTTSQETISRSDIEDLRVVYRDSELAKSVTIQANTRVIDQAADVYEHGEPIIVPSGETLTVIAQITNPIYSLNSVSYDAHTLTGQDISGNVSLVQTQYATRFVLAFTNSHTEYAASITNLKINAKWADSGQSIEIDLTSADTFWNNRDGRTRRIRGNKFVQTAPQAESLANMVQGRQETPSLYYIMMGMPGDASRRLGDHITINDTEVMTTSKAAFITSISWRVDNQGFVQDMEAIDRADLFEFPGEYFVVGTNVLGTSGGSVGRVYY